MLHHLLVDIRNDALIGDWGIVRVDASRKIIFDIEWNDERYKQYKEESFLIIGRSDKQYCLQVKGFTESDVVSNRHIQSFGIDEFYINIECFFIRKESLLGRVFPNYYKDVLSCRLCGKTAPYAIPNLPDRKSFVCWACRQDGRCRERLNKLSL